MSSRISKQVSEQLIAGCLKGDSTAERALYDALLPYLNKVVYRYLSNSSYHQDVLQDSFIQLFRYLSSFQPEKGNLVAWAAKIAINVAIRYNRKAATLNVYSLDEEITAQHTTIPSERIEKLSYEDLLLLLRQLPDSYYTVFNLAVIEEYSHREIGEILGITEASSRKKLSRAKAWLRKRFTESTLTLLIPSAL